MNNVNKHFLKIIPTLTIIHSGISYLILLYLIKNTGLKKVGINLLN